MKRAGRQNYGSDTLVLHGFDHRVHGGQPMTAGSASPVPMELRRNYDWLPHPKAGMVTAEETAGSWR